MPAPLLSIETTATLPSAADAVVIGGGIVGACTAYYLARRGVTVALLEKGHIGGEQSSRNWGWCRQQNRDVRELPLSTRELRALGGDGRRHRRKRRLPPHRAALSLERRGGDRRRAGWRDFARTQGVVTKNMLSSAEATERGRATGKPWKGGVFSPTDGTADPASAAPR